MCRLASLVQLGHLGLRQPDGLAIETNLQIQAAVVVDEQLPLGCRLVVHDSASRGAPPSDGELAYRHRQAGITPGVSC